MHYHQKMANMDMMTRLDSRTAFEECIRQVSILDINNLKQANDANIYRLGGVVV